MKSSIFFTVESGISDYTLDQVRESARGVPGIERVVPLPDEGPNHLHLAVCEEGADFDVVYQKVSSMPHVISSERAKIL